MDTGYTTNDCSAEEARIAELEAYVRELLEKIQCLEALVDCQSEVIDCLESIIFRARMTLAPAQTFLAGAVRKTRSVLARKSGVPRGVWSYAKGIFETARPTLKAVDRTMEILSEGCGGCGGGC